jgi:hypothetical protein
MEKINEIQLIGGVNKHQIDWYQANDKLNFIGKNFKNK